MKIVKLPKGAGKTTEMLVWLLEGHAQGIKRALIVPSNNHARLISRRLQELYRESGNVGYINDAANRIYTLDAARKVGGSHFRDMEVGIDDADTILSYLIFNNHRRPSIISVTEESESIGVAAKSVSEDEEVEIIWT